MQPNNLKTNKLLIHLIAAARPNFMKIAPLYHALKKEDWAEPFIVHTGQHYDLNMSDAFFKDLALPEPDIHLGIGSGTHAEQTGHVMIAYEKILIETRPDLVVVVGDVNSTVACTLAASKIHYPGSVTQNLYPVESRRACPEQSAALNSPSKGYSTGAVSRIQDRVSSIPDRPLVGHLEAGLRSFDRTMPEEINRIVTDALADILWTPSPDADENLIREGVSRDKIHRVGNIMIDSLEMLRDKIQEQNAFEELSLEPGNYGLITLHRPSNVDDQNVLKQVCVRLAQIARKIPLVFPVHPRTRKTLRQNGLMGILSDSPKLHTVEPMNYIKFMNLLFNCRLVITDSGGIQEETTYLGIPCLTMRPNTERPITIQQGTNQLCDHVDLEEKTQAVISGKADEASIPEYWDGHAATRVVNSIKSFIV